MPNKKALRSIIFRWWWKDPTLSLCRLRLLTLTWFLAGLQNWGSRLVRADPFVFEVFIKVRARFPGRARLTLRSV